MTKADPWQLRNTDEGWRLYYRGRRFMHDPKPTEREAREYLERVKPRYRNDSALILCEPEEGRETTGRQRGGPWRYTYPSLEGEGETTGVVRTSRLQDAKQILRSELERQRLPNGIEWEIER